MSLWTSSYPQHSCEPAQQLGPTPLPAAASSTLCSSSELVRTQAYGHIIFSTMFGPEGLSSQGSHSLL